MINLKRSMLLLIVFSCLFMTISCAFASEINDMNNATGIEDADLSISVSQINEEKLATNESGLNDFDELKMDMGNLRPGDIYYFEKDYQFNNQTNQIIEIATDNIKIKGNSHTIDACGNSIIFKITGNNVSINNLIFINFNVNNTIVIGNESFTSPIVWSGDNGKLFDPSFIDCVGLNGGALSWSGNKGTISYGLFENTIALNKGGAIEISGENNKIMYATFINFSSALANEAIYCSNKNNGKNTTLNIDGCYFENQGTVSGVTNVVWDDGCEITFNGVDVNNGNYNELCNDLENLKPGDYYNIMADYTIVNPTGELARNRIINIKADNITINGNGHKIDGKGAKNFFAIFNITGNNVTITNLEIRDSSATNYEYSISNLNIYENNYTRLTSPIEWNGDNGVISNCTFYQTSGETGGSINWIGNNGTIENCIFYNTSATKFGGSVYVSGNSNKIVNSTFINSYTLYHFEAIYLTNESTLCINNCTFKSNDPGAKVIEVEKGCEVTYIGGKPVVICPPTDFVNLYYLLSILKDNEVLTIEHNYYLRSFEKFPTINANNVTINGNGYKIYGEQPASHVLCINASNVKINDLTLDFLYEDLEGASYINWIGDNGTLADCTITGNRAKEGAITWTGNNAIIDNCVFNNNTAQLGSAISIEGANNTISNCFFTSCQATAYIYSTNKNKVGALNILNCSFNEENGSVRICIGDDSEVIFDGKSIPRTCDELFDDISNLEENGTYYIYRNYIFNSTDGNFTINNNNIIINGNGHTFDGNSSSVFFKVSGNDVKIFNLTFINGKSYNYTVTPKIGGVTPQEAASFAKYGRTIDVSPVYWSGANGLISNCIFEKNTAINGSAITWTGNNGIIKNSIFRDNIASASGAVYWSGTNGSISGCTFEGNEAVNGGAIFWRGNEGVIRNSIFQNNVASTGGVVYWSGTNGLISDCIFEKNTANNGGAISWMGNEGVIRNSIFQNNVASTGGAVYWSGTNGSISDCIFEENEAVNGGAISWMGNEGVIKTSVFLNNTARGVGGAIYIGGINNTIAYSSFLNSISQLTGESIFLDREHNNTNLINVSSDVLCIDGALYNIDVTNLLYSYYSYVGDKQINLISIIYQTLIYGVVIIENEDLYGYSQFLEGGFSLSMIRNFEEYDILYQKDYLFTNATLDNIFKLVLNGDFKNSIIIAKTLNVTGTINDLWSSMPINDVIEHSYEYACSCTAENLIINSPVMSMVKPDLLGLVGAINRFTGVTYGLNIMCPTGKVFNSNAQWKTDNGFDVVNIFGNGAIIHATSGDRDENKWIKTAKNQLYMVYDLTVEGFNTAIYNREGTCVLSNVVLNNNHMDYIVERDDGAAILNSAYVICHNCTFSNNYAKNGGAIFNQGQLTLSNCTFYNNHGYGTGNDILNVDSGIVTINDEQINGTQGVVTYVESIPDWQTALISAVAGLGTFAIAIAAGAIVFATGGAALVAIGVGVGVGGVAGIAIGSYAAYSITSRQYNLAFDRVATASSIIMGCVILGIVGGVIGATVVGPHCKAKQFYQDWTNKKFYEECKNFDEKSTKDLIKKYGLESAYDELVGAIESQDVDEINEAMSQFERSAQETEISSESGNIYGDVGKSIMKQFIAKWPCPNPNQVRALIKLLSFM